MGESTPGERRDTLYTQRARLLRSNFALLILIIQIWWALWVLRDRAEWAFPVYVLLILPYLTIALIAYVITPELAEGEKDIKRYYYENCRWLFSLAAIYLVTTAIFGLTVLHQPFVELGNMIRYAGIVLTLALAVWKSERFHVAACVFAYLLVVAWIGIRNLRL